MSLACPALWGFLHIEHLICFLLLEKGDRGIDPKESKDACQAILDLHSALPTAICVVLENVYSDEGIHGAVYDGWARVVPVLVRDCCELPVAMRM